MVIPWGFESPLSHQKSEIPLRVSQIFYAQKGLEPTSMQMSGGHLRLPVQKLAATLIFRKAGNAIESSLSHPGIRRIRNGCGWNLNTSEAQKRWYGCTFLILWGLEPTFMQCPVGVAKRRLDGVCSIVYSSPLSRTSEKTLREFFLSGFLLYFHNFQ